MDFSSFLFLLLVIANLVLAAVSAVYAKEAQETSAECLRRQIWSQESIQRTIAKLNDYQIKEIRKCNSKGYRRLSNDYERQFAEWRKLERLGVGYADGLGEVEEYWLHDFGKHIKKSLAACE